MKVATSALTPEQLAYRRTRIGSSDIPAIAGLNPWKSPIDVWLDKMGKAERRESTAGRLGKLFEAAIAQVYAEDHGCDLIVPGTITHQERDWQVATPDRLVPSVRVVEIKLVGRNVAHHWDGGVPVYVTAQATWEMDVAGLSEGHVVAAVCGTDYRVEPVTLDVALAETLREIGEQFWRDHILAQKPPSIDASDRWRDYFRDLFPAARGKKEEANSDEERIAAAILRARRAKKAAEDAEAKSRHELMERIGERPGLIGNGWSASWPNSQKTHRGNLIIREAKQQ